MPRVAFTAITAGLLALSAACTVEPSRMSDPSNSAGTSAEPGADTGVPGQGGTVTIRGCSPQNPLVPGNTADACGGDLVDATTAMLVRYDSETGEAQNDIAQSITTTDNLTYTVRLGPGYLFHDGSAVTASSFVDAWNHTAYGPNKQLNASFFEPVAGYDQVHPADGGTPSARTLSGLDVLDDHTFTVTLHRPVANLVVRLGYRAFAPLPDSFFADREAFERAPVGAGPYRVAEIGDDTITLHRFEGYVGDTPGQVDEVRVRVYGSVDAAYKDAQSGLLDVTRDLPRSALADARYRRDFPGRFTTRPVGTSSTLNFASREADPDAAVQNPAFRQALSMAIDREAIDDEYFGGLHIPATGWVSPLVTGYRPGGCGDYCTYDPERARQLLEEAGGHSGQLTLWYNADSDHGHWTGAVCRSIRLAIGVNCVSTPVLDLSTFRDRIDSHTITDMYRSAWLMNYPSIDNYLTPMFSTGGTANNAGYSNPEFDALLHRAAAAPSADARAGLYQEAERMLQADMPAIPLFDHRAVAVWSPRVMNVSLTPKGAVDLTRIQVVG